MARELDAQASVSQSPSISRLSPTAFGAEEQGILSRAREAKKTYSHALTHSHSSHPPTPPPRLQHESRRLQTDSEWRPSDPIDDLRKIPVSTGANNRSQPCDQMEESGALDGRLDSFLRSVRYKSPSPPPPTPIPSLSTHT